jgi:hypothetical protein
MRAVNWERLLFFELLYQFLVDRVIELRHRRVMGDELGLARGAAYAGVEDLPDLIAATAGEQISHKFLPQNEVR